MRTSLTGASNKLAAAHAGGFTLLEILVVVAVIGIVLVLVRLQAPDRARQQLALEAQRFEQTMQDCRDLAVISAAPAGVMVEGSSYQLVRYRGAWEGQDEAREVPVEMVFEQASATREDERERPVVLCLPSGEAELSALTLMHRGMPGHYTFAPDIDGHFRANWVSSL